MDDLKIKISTQAELGGFAAATAQLEAQIGKAKALGKEYEALEARLVAAQKAMQEFKASESSKKWFDDATKVPMPVAPVQQQSFKPLGLQDQLDNQFRSSHNLAGQSRDDYANFWLNNVAATPAPPTIPVPPKLDQIRKVANDDEFKAAKAIEASLLAQITHSKVLGQSYGENAQRLANIRKSMEGYTLKTNWLGGLRAELEQTFPIIGRLSGAMSGFAAGGLAMVAAGFAAIGTAIFGAKKAILEFSQAQDQVAKLDAALAQTGQLTDDYRQRLQDLADEMENATGIDDARWINVIKRLTQFGATAKDIDKTTTAVKNLAGIMEGDVEGAAQAVSKAMQGSFDMFRRYGIVVEEAGSQSDKLEKLFQNLATRGGGQLEAMSKTLSGQFVTLRNNIGDFFKGIGGGIASTGVLQNSLEFLGNMTEWYADAIKRTIPQIQGLNNAQITAKDTTLSADEAAKKYADNLKAIGEGADAATEALKRYNSEIDKQKSHEQRMLDIGKARALKNWEIEKNKAKVQGRPVSEIDDLEAKSNIDIFWEQKKQDLESQALAKKEAAAQRQVDIDKANLSQGEKIIQGQTARAQTAKKIELGQSRSDYVALQKKAADAKPPGTIEGLFNPADIVNLVSPLGLFKQWSGLSKRVDERQTTPQSSPEAIEAEKRNIGKLAAGAKSGLANAKATAPADLHDYTTEKDTLTKWQLEFSKEREVTNKRIQDLEARLAEFQSERTYSQEEGKGTLGNMVVDTAAQFTGIRAKQSTQKPKTAKEILSGNSEPVEPQNDTGAADRFLGPNLQAQAQQVASTVNHIAVSTSQDITKPIDSAVNNLQKAFDINARNISYFLDFTNTLLNVSQGHTEEIKKLKSQFSAGRTQ
jgi:hypothetical protein